MCERLRTKDISKLFGIKESTLRSWRRCRGHDKRFPRFHKITPRMVYYIEAEFREDLEAMEKDNEMEGMAV